MEVVVLRCEDVAGVLAYAHEAFKWKKILAFDKTLSKPLFALGGFSDWKGASRFLRVMKSLVCLRKLLISYMIVISKSHKSVEILCSSITDQRRENRLYLIKVAQNISTLPDRVFLCLVMRFAQLTKVGAVDDTKRSQYLAKKTDILYMI